MRYRTIDVRIWGDEKFRSLSALKPSGQGLFLYLLTNPNTNPIPGLYRAGAAAMSEELGWRLEVFKECFQEALEQGLVKADFNARLVFIPNAIKFNKPQSPNVVISWAASWDELPECELKNEAYHILKDFLKGLGDTYLKAFCKAIRKASRIQEHEHDHDQEEDQNQKSIGGIVDLHSGKLEQMNEVFVYWQNAMGHLNAKLDSKRCQKILKALETYDLAQLKQAIDGCSKTPYNMGDNDRNQRYDDIELILRDAPHTERFIKNALTPPKIINSAPAPMEGAV